MNARHRYKAALLMASSYTGLGSWMGPRISPLEATPEMEYVLQLAIRLDLCPGTLAHPPVVLPGSHKAFP